jgi:hypothetical protein
MKAVLETIVREASEELFLHAKRIELVGSTYIHGQGNDIDILVLLDSAAPTCLSVASLILPGWIYGGSTPKSGDGWCSWKQGDINLLVTADQTYFNAWVTAAEVCRYLALRGVKLEKPDRIAVHAIIMDDKDCGDFAL